MQISVFKKVTMPKNKKEKGMLAKYSSSPHLPTVVECNDIKSLINVITKFGYSPIIFNDTRKQSNFLHTDFAILDIDDGLTIEESLSRVTELDLMCICLTTLSHTPENHRFRLIFPLSQRISGTEEFVSSMENLRDIFPEADEHCVTDYARFYFPSHLTDDGYIYEGSKLLKPHRPSVSVPNTGSKTSQARDLVPVGSSTSEAVEVIYGTKRDKIPRCVEFFINEAKSGIDGGWINALNSFCFVLSVQGVESTLIYDVVTQLAPYPLDSKDEYQIERACNDGEGARNE